MTSKNTNWTLFIIGGMAIAILCVIAFFAVPYLIAQREEEISRAAIVDRSQVKNASAEQIVNGYNQNGVTINVNFEVDARKNIQCVIIILFYDESGNPLRDKNGSLATDTGQVAIGKYFTPEYDTTEVTKMLLFIPIEELHLDNGITNFKYQIELREKDSGALIAKSDYYDFSITK